MKEARKQAKGAVSDPKRTQLQDCVKGMLSLKGLFRRAPVSQQTVWELLVDLPAAGGGLSVPLPARSWGAFPGLRIPRVRC